MEDAPGLPNEDTEKEAASGRRPDDDFSLEELIAIGGMGCNYIVPFDPRGGLLDGQSTAPAPATKHPAAAEVPEAVFPWKPDERWGISLGG